MPVSSLESTIPLLLGKLSSLENRRNKNATVSENIVRIRQLITQARNAASKVGLWVSGVWGEWRLTWGCFVIGRSIWNSSGTTKQGCFLMGKIPKVHLEQLSGT